jgi:hypothetical protein
MDDKTRKAAEHHLISAVLMFRRAGLSMVDVLGLAVRFWLHPHEESARIQSWRP